jgi:hypothetical protein
VGEETQNAQWWVVQGYDESNGSGRFGHPAKGPVPRDDACNFYFFSSHSSLTATRRNQSNQKSSKTKFE